jgi:hypothetical protein
VLGFNHPEFRGEIIAELERLRESDTVRVIDSLAVYKDADGELEVEQVSNLSEEEAIELASKVGIQRSSTASPRNLSSVRSRSPGYSVSLTASVFIRGPRARGRNGLPFSWLRYAR